MKYTEIENKIAEAQKTIDEANEMLKALRSSKIKRPEIGRTVEIAGMNWTVLDKNEQGYICLGDKIEKLQFGTTNDWKESSVREYLNGEFHQKLSEQIGAENIILFSRDLLSLDGQTEYGTCEDSVSLISLDEYRKYRKYIPNAEYYWWMLTPDSTRCNNDSKWTSVVYPSGGVCSDLFGNHFGVRPFCIFSSSLFESEEE